MALNVAVAVIDIQGITEKTVGQGGADSGHTLAGDHDGGLFTTELRQGGRAHNAGYRCLRTGNQRAQGIHEAALGLVLNLCRQIFPPGFQYEIDSNVRQSAHY